MYADLAREVVERCRLLASCSDEPGFTTRTFLSESMRQVHAAVSKWMTRAGMSVRVDSAGNIRGVSGPAAARGARLIVGSHLDTVPHAGAFDGVLGVVMGIALVQSVQARQIPFAIEVIGFSEEEGVRFGVPFIGSRALVADLDDALLTTQDARGVAVGEAIRNFGLDPAHLRDARVEPNVRGYLEFHIEQGPVLDSLDRPVAVVDRIVGRTCADAVFNGDPGHAGTTPMERRRDALTGAAEWIGRVDEHARRTAGLLATLGQIDVEPGAANVIPGRCRVSVDLRHADDEVRTIGADHCRVLGQEIAARRGLGFEWSLRFDHDATVMDASLVAALTRAIERAGAPRMVMPSGAGHDAMIVAAHVPAVMLFIRTPRGLSHHPDEAVSADDVAVALEAGVNFLDELTGTLDG